MHTDYSSDKSGNSSDRSYNSGTGSESENNTEALTLACDADGKVLCTCGCKRRRTPRTVFRHLRSAHLRQKIAKKKSRSIDLEIPDTMDNPGAPEDNGEPAGQMREAEAEYQELPSESNE